MVLSSSNLRPFLILFFLSIILTSCGGGGGGNSGITTDTSGTCKNGSSSSYCTTEFHANYGLKNIKAYEAYEDGYTGSGVKVAVLDGGFQSNHAELDTKWTSGYDEEDDDGTPFAESHTAAMGGHGTHVAGIIAAEKNNFDNVTGDMHGVAYDSLIIPIKIFTDNAVGLEDITNSVAHGVDQGAIALNNSWGSSGWTSAASCGGITCYGFIPGTSSSGFNTTAELNEWEDVKTENKIAVFAAGNNGNNSETGSMKFYSSQSTSSSLVNTYSSQVVKNAGLIDYTNRSTYEARYGLQSAVSGNWINVVAVDSTNTIASYSNGCGDTKNFCIAAPGSSIHSTVPTDLAASGYGTKSGTSMAAPHVSGAIALLRQKWPNLTGAQIVNLLINNATDLGDSGIDDVYGVGLLNLKGSMEASGALKISYIDENGNLQKYDLESSSINSNNLLKNLIIELPIGVVDDYERVYSVRLNDIGNTTVNNDNYLYDRHLDSSKQHLPVNGGLFYITNNGYKNYEFSAKNRKYSYDFNSYEKYIFNNQQNFHIPIGQAVTLTTNADELKSYILKSNYQLTHKDYNLNIETGLISERESLLGSTFSGAFDINDSQTYFASFKNSYNINGDILKFNIGYGLTKSSFADTNFIEITDIHTFDSTLAFEKKLHQSKFSTALEIPLYVAQGDAKFTNISGYDKNGIYKNTSQVIDLSSDEIYAKINFYYDVNINEDSNFGTKYFIDNYNYSEVQFVYNKKF
tara:strand:+ start:685 stop:2916 length:2232 start_codon:yes stop_codon:yes gene_type:complete